MTDKVEQFIRSQCRTLHESRYVCRDKEVRIFYALPVQVQALPGRVAQWQANGVYVDLHCEQGRLELCASAKQPPVVATTLPGVLSRKAGFVVNLWNLPTGWTMEQTYDNVIIDYPVRPDSLTLAPPVSTVRQRGKYQPPARPACMSDDEGETEERQSESKNEQNDDSDDETVAEPKSPPSLCWACLFLLFFPVSLLFLYIILTT